MPSSTTSSSTTASSRNTNNKTSDSNNNKKSSGPNSNLMTPSKIPSSSDTSFSGVGQQHHHQDPNSLRRHSTLGTIVAHNNNNNHDHDDDENDNVEDDFKFASDDGDNSPDGSFYRNDTSNHSSSVDNTNTENNNNTNNSSSVTNNNNRSSTGSSIKGKQNNHRSTNSASTSSITSSSKNNNNNNNSKYGTIKFDAPLGRDPEKARRALLEASDDALGVHRRTFIRRFTMFIKLIIFLALVATLAFLAQQVTSIRDFIASLLSDVTLVRAIADGKPIAAGSAVSFTVGGVQQGHGPTVGVAVTALPCDPEPTASRLSSRVFFPNGNSSSTAVVSAATTKSSLVYWMVDSQLSDENNEQRNTSLNTTDENSAADSHIALAGVGSTTFNGGDYTKSPFIVISGAAYGSSSIYLHLLEDPSNPTLPKATILASYFTVSSSSTTDRSKAFAVTIPPPTYFASSSSSTTTNGEVAVVGYACGDNICCVDLISWSTGGKLSGTDGPRLNIPSCPDHAVHFPAISSSTRGVSQVVLPTVPVIVLTVDVDANTVKVSQTLKLPISFAGISSSLQIGNSSSARVRATSIPPPHSKKSVLISVALHDTIQIFQLLPATNSKKTFLVPTLFASIPTGLSGPISSLSGFVFSTTNSWASVYFRDANKFQFMIQVSFLSSLSNEISIPRQLPTIGGAEIESLWLSEVWRHTMVIIRESPKFCGLRSVEWQGGINFAGFAGSTVQAGQSVDVYTGGIVRIFANLVPGTRYAVGVNGSVVALHDPLALRTSDEYNVVGKALSKTEMFLFPTR